MEGDYELVLTHGAGTLTVTPSSALVTGDPVLLRNENRPQQLRFVLLLPDIASRNLMSSSCALWSSGTGALAIGDRVQLYLYPTSSGVRTAVFYGVVHELAVEGDNLVTVEAREDWERAEKVQRDVIIHSGHQDLVYKSTTTDAQGRTVIQGLTETDISLPLSVIKLMSMEEIEEQAPGGSEFTSNGYLLFAQRFIANHSQLIGVRFSALFGNLFPLTNLTAEVRTDNSGNPGTVLRSAVLPSPDIIRDGNVHPYWANFLSSGAPLEISTGAHYWIVLRTNRSAMWNIVRNSNPNIPTDHALVLKASTDGTTWTMPDLGSLTLTFYGGDYDWTTESAQSLSGSDLTLHGEAKVKGLPKNVTTVPPVSLTPKRAIVSYYWNKSTILKVLQALMGRAGLTYDVPIDLLNDYVKLYRTKGKCLAECVREVCDLRMGASSYAGSQLSVAQDPAGATVYVRRRKHTGDASSFTFSYGGDTAVSNEHRIIAGGVKLRRTAKMKPTRVRVIGKAPDGLPLVAVVHDKALANSFSAKLGHDVEETLQDDSLRTLEDCRAYGKAYLDSVRQAYDAWEGQLVISGVYPDLFDLSTASSTFGSGQIVTLNYSPLGISGVRLKVKGIRVQGVKTEVTLSSEDLLINNPWSDTAWRAARSESFVSPADAEENAIVEAHVAQYLIPVYYITLARNGTDLTNLVPTVRSEYPELGLEFAHAELEGADGYTSDTLPANQLRLYDSGKNYFATATIEDTYKWKTARVIVELSYLWS